MEDINIWFSYNFNGVKSHARYKEYTNILIYKYKIEEKKYMDFLCDELNWILILSLKKFWLWKPDVKELVELNIKDIRLFLGYPSYQSNKEFSFSNEAKIIEKYLSSPLSIEEILKILNIQDSFKKNEVEKKLAIDSKFFIASWVQNI